MDARLSPEGFKPSRSSLVFLVFHHVFTNFIYTDDDVDISDHHVTAASQPKAKVKALEDTAREETYMSSMRAERLRVARIRKARSAAEVIQKSWRNYKQRRR